MISIPITEEAYEALKTRMARIDQTKTPKGRNGEMRITVDREFVDRLLVFRLPGESYSDVIVRLAKGDGRLQAATGFGEQRDVEPRSPKCVTTRNQS